MAIFEGLSDEQLDWLSEHGERIDLGVGEYMFTRGERADSAWFVVEGSIQGFEEIGGQWLLVATTTPGEVTGMLPFSRMTHYPRNTIAAEPSRVLRLPASRFPELLAAVEEVGRRLVAQMSDRVRGDVRLEQQGEKMKALGRLSAGLAHELNNPAAAIRRAAGRLTEHRERLPALVAALVGHQLSAPALHTLEQLRLRGVHRDGESGPATEASDREEILLEWLEGRGVTDPWDVAATLGEAGVTADDLSDLEREMPDGALEDAVAWLSRETEAGWIVKEITAAADRISDLIASIKTYSHMDRSREHKPTDVPAGIDNTVTMLGHKLKAKSIRLTRDYAPDVPPIPANAGELNQVWTNLIDNAIDAMEPGGELILRTRRNDMWVEVEVIDDGAGIPEEIRANIFEPFFTTKEVGVGTGLGLGIAQRIVRTHRGHIEVRSIPGTTRFCVRLPVTQTAPGPS